MKTIKKLLALTLVLCMVFCLSVAVFAEGETAKVDQKDGNDLTDHLDKQPVVAKKYQVNNGTAPDEEFTFKFEAVSYKDIRDVTHNATEEGVNIPAIDDVKISFAALSSTETDTAKINKTVQATINTESYDLGVYTYKVTEVAPTAPDTKTAGVTYSPENLFLVLTILRDEDSGKHYVAAMHYETASGTDKTTGFTNKYDSGSLTLTKYITGNMAIMSDKFEFTITLTAPEGTEIKSEISSNSQSGSWKGNVYTIELGDKESVTLSNIPAGTTYEITETNKTGYTATSVFSDPSKTISKNDADTVTFTNNKTAEIDTGITLDSLPYILALAVAFGGAVVLFTRKRHVED